MNSIDKLIRLRDRSAAAIRAFWNWWIGELDEILCKILPQLTPAAGSVVSVETDGDRLTLTLSGGEQRARVHSTKIGSPSPPDFNAPQSQEGVTLTIPQNFALLKQILLPRSARADLPTIIRNQIDWVTPFRPEQCYYGWTARPASDNQLAIELAVTPKARLAEICKILKSWGLEVARLRVIAPAGDINLYADGEAAPIRAFSRSPAEKSVLAIAASLALLGVAATIFNAVRLNGLEARAESLRAAAVEAAAMRNRYEEARRNAAMLVERKSSHLPAIAVLNETTRVLDDETWLEQFVLRDGEVQLIGYSAQASMVLSALESSPIFSNTRFIAAVTFENDLNAERFHVAADLKRFAGDSEEAAR
ncbi:MAG: hypothetical protein Tsb0010_04240 [Parvularculaceae bacterium]